MNIYSPLRYPGGKRKLANFLALVCKKNNIEGHYIEPYAGGAAVALHLLINDYVYKITINDLDRAIYSFWFSILNNTEKFCDKINKTEVTLENWRKFKKIHENKEKESIFNVGFATFFLNRTNHSGIIDGGVIGGLKQKGIYKINCRFKKSDLIERIRLIAEHKDNIEIKNMDALDLVDEIEESSGDKNTIFYFDPPYYLKGPSLYMNHYNHNDHQRVSERISKIKNMKWIVSYDNVPEIRKMYSGIKKRDYSLTHTAYEIREGKEVMFFDPKLTVPRFC